MFAARHGEAMRVRWLVIPLTLVACSQSDDRLPSTTITTEPSLEVVVPSLSIEALEQPSNEAEPRGKEPVRAPEPVILESDISDSVFPATLEGDLEENGEALIQTSAPWPTAHAGNVDLFKEVGWFEIATERRPDLAVTVLQSGGNKATVTSRPGPSGLNSASTTVTIG